MKILYYYYARARIELRNPGGERRARLQHLRQIMSNPGRNNNHCINFYLIRVKFYFLSLNFYHEMCTKSSFNDHIFHQRPFVTLGYFICFWYYQHIVYFTYWLKYLFVLGIWSYNRSTTLHVLMFFDMYRFRCSVFFKIRIWDEYKILLIN